MFLLLLPILTPVFVTVAIGYAWTRWGGRFDSDLVAKMVSNIFAPALVFSTLTSSTAEPTKILIATLAIVACMLLAGALGYALLRFLKVSIRAYLPAAMFPNLGNVGGPVCYFAFGEEGLAYAVAVMAAGGIAMWTLGAWISSGHLSPRRALTAPPVIAALLGAVFVAFGWHLPGWTQNTFEVLGAPTFPLMLLALGSSLATMKVMNVPLSVGLGVFRVAAGALVGLFVAELLGLTGALRGVIILQSAMPSAVFNFLFAQMNDRQPDEVAGVVVASTLISAVTLPLLVSFVLSLN